VSKVPSLHYRKVVGALQRAGWIIVRQRGSHIRLQRRIGDELLKITVPAHRPIKRSTLSHLLRDARLSVEEFLDLLR
jgi:predicted RNA binding protein YcfA (HicA-like mRNA interferase family)